VKLLLALGALLSAEFGLRRLVRWLRRDCQWLITEADELPPFDQAALRKFLAGSFDPQLGWVRRPNTEGSEKGAAGTIVFHVDEHGARHNGTTDSRPAHIAAFGDSYVFGRQVEDHETWCAVLGRQSSGAVLNFGVGNYGADQGLLRYENTELPTDIKFAILGFVPETICRVQSYWKHYLEFGNTFAFKPRFVLSPSGDLQLLPCAVSSEADFLGIRNRIDHIRRDDGFYQRKFRALQFRGSYLLSLARQPGRQLELLHAALARKLAPRGNSPEPFGLVVKRNIREAHAMYREAGPRQLLHAILERFAASARQRGHQPLVLVLPQLYDLRADSASTAAYREFFAAAGRHIPLLDLTETLRREDIDSLYVEDSYGGHLSARGNALVAGCVANWLQAHGGAPACTPDGKPGQSSQVPCS
jgi:hypothetical protein